MEIPFVLILRGLLQSIQVGGNWFPGRPIDERINFQHSCLVSSGGRGIEGWSPLAGDFISVPMSGELL